MWYLCICFYIFIRFIWLFLNKIDPSLGFLCKKLQFQIAFSIPIINLFSPSIYFSFNLSYRMPFFKHILKFLGFDILVIMYCICKKMKKKIKYLFIYNICIIIYSIVYWENFDGLIAERVMSNNPKHIKLDYSIRYNLKILNVYILQSCLFYMMYTIWRDNIYKNKLIWFNNVYIWVMFFIWSFLSVNFIKGENKWFNVSISSILAYNILASNFLYWVCNTIYFNFIILNKQTNY